MVNVRHNHAVVVVPSFESGMWHLDCCGPCIDGRPRKFCNGPPDVFWILALLKEGTLPIAGRVALPHEPPLVMTGVDLVYHHDFHPPDEVRVFAVPTAAIRRWDDSTLVYDVLIDGLVLRHYAFTDRWFAVNCTLDRRGQFMTEPGSIDWCFNCDIATPLFSVGSNVYTVDLALDVLVGPDGHTHIVQDEDDFTYAVEHGWLSIEEQVGARRGLEELLRIIEAAGLVAYLEQVCPFGVISDPILSPPMTTLRVAEVPLFHSSMRGRIPGGSSHE